MGNNRRNEGTANTLDDAFDLDQLIISTTPAVGGVPMEGAPEKTGPERKPCPECGKNVTWTKAGKPRQHKCVIMVTPVTVEAAANTVENLHPTGAITADLVIAKFVETRDLITEKRKALSNELADLNDLQEKRGLWLKGELDKLGLISFKSVYGTCFFVEKTSATVADRQEFMDWVQSDWESHKDFLENRVSKTAVKQRLDDGETLPPGVDYTKFRDVQIRRS